MGGQVGGFRYSKSALLAMGAVLVLAIGVSSCAKPPVAEMEAAKAAIEKAKEMEALEYAANDLRAAQDSLAKAEAELNTQNGKFALFRSYKKALALYLSAQATAETAATNAVANKEQAKRDATAAIEQAKQSIAGTRELLASKEVMALKRGKETREALKQIEAELNAVDSTLVGIEQELQREKYKSALQAARSAGQKVQNLMTEIQQAVETKKAIGRMPRQ